MLGKLQKIRENVFPFAETAKGKTPQKCFHNFQKKKKKKKTEIDNGSQKREICNFYSHSLPQPLY